MGTLMLALRHKLKSKTKHDIPLDADDALTNSAFAVYRNEKAGTIEHTGIGWRLLSTQKGVDGKKAKYDGHEFEILIAPEALDKFIAALEWAREEFKK